MTTTTTTNRWLDLAEICAHLDVEPSKLGAASRKGWYAGADTIEFDFDGVIIRKQGKYQGAKYRIL